MKKRNESFILYSIEKIWRNVIKLKKLSNQCRITTTKSPCFQPKYWYFESYWHTLNNHKGKGIWDSDNIETKRY